MLPTLHLGAIYRVVRGGPRTPLPAHDGLARIVGSGVKPGPARVLALRRHVRGLFKAGRPGSAVVADPTEVSTWEARSSGGRARLLQPLRSRLGDGRAQRAELVVEAVEMAVVRRQPAAGLVHHSDQGSQYVSQSLASAGARPASTSRWERRAPRSTTRPANRSSARSRRNSSASAAGQEERAEERDLRVDRGLVQPAPAALDARVPPTAQLQQLLLDQGEMEKEAA
jgi:hypothetical protein